MKGRPTCSPWSMTQPIDLEDFAEWWPHLCAKPWELRADFECFDWVYRDMAVPWKPASCAAHGSWPMSATRPHLCTGPRDWHPFWWMKDGENWET